MSILILINLIVEGECFHKDKLRLLLTRRRSYVSIFLFSGIVNTNNSSKQAVLKGYD